MFYFLDDFISPHYFLQTPHLKPSPHWRGARVGVLHPYNIKKLAKHSGSKLPPWGGADLEALNGS